MTDLTTLLHTTFGFPAFRANQEAVCRAVIAGRDALLVMPTGAGKSLCYQLPAIARGGTALVVSPLIALMDDQAAKLTAAGLRVARIHSNLSRDDARTACRDYLSGSLDFLFIAPERMRVPGFPEMLARRKPTLVAIDEAHCISVWGHDFRPDYRTLGDHLPALRPAPILALTATATPTVQKDIVAQLQLHNPALFIHGFRRSNLAIEVVELSKPRRHEFTVKLLSSPAARPAIVYTPSRRDSEALAADLNRHFPAAAYHAGLDASVRQSVQRKFQSGKLEVVVATIAFGMGIDKADVRTIVHTALPASVEAFYQEIGRAGRDGLPSRSVLLHSFVDRKIHESFLDRDYPPASDLARVAAVLTDDFLMPEPLCRKLKMAPDLFTKSVEKLAAQGAVQLDFAGNVRLADEARRADSNPASPASWRAAYEAQIAFRRSQIDRMVAFAETQQCRMTAIIRHFGDTADAHRPCGICDFCSPATTTAQTFRPPTPEDLRQLMFILQELDDRSRSTGKLFTALSEGALRNTAAGKDRKTFDTLLDALSRAALIALTPDTFTNPEGNVITYKKAALTHEGREAAATGILLTYNILLPDTNEVASTKKKASRSSVKSASSHTPSKSSPPREINKSVYSEDQKTLEKALLVWRKEEAKRAAIPEFFILSAAVLHGIVTQCPTSLSQLLTISGIGPEKADRFGAAIIAICRAATTNVSPSASLPEMKPSSRPARSEVEGPPHFSRPIVSIDESPAILKKRLKRIAEDFTPIKEFSKKTRLRSHEYNDATNRRIDFEDDLRLFAKDQSEKLNLTEAAILSASAIKDILNFRPRTQDDLDQLPNLRGDLPASFYKSLLITCTAGYKPQQEPVKQPRMQVALPSTAVKEPTSPIQLFSEPTPTFHRTRTTAPSDPAAALTPAQQLLDAELRAWRKSEAERIGLPQFFVLGSSALRSIVLLCPKSIAQLQTISGIGPEKAEKFGPAILALCNA
jgi:ATP-dependent DNA helicase RecQ